MVALFLALTAATPLLDTKAACRLAETVQIERGKVYSVRGTYKADGMHGSILQLSQCDHLFAARLVGDASVAVTAWREAYRVKCGDGLFGDHINGVFTGTFITRNRESLGRGSVDGVFDIRSIETKDLDVRSIICASN